MNGCRSAVSSRGSSVSITSGASLQRKLSDAHLKGISIGMQLMEKREQDIEHGHQRGQSSLDRRTQAMMHVLEATDNGTIDKAVSTHMRSFQVSFSHSLRWSGMPAAQRKPRSASTMLWSCRP